MIDTLTIAIYAIKRKQTNTPGNKKKKETKKQTIKHNNEIENKTNKETKTKQQQNQQKINLESLFILPFNKDS